jgi:UDP-2,4-diacetamido-2,4,6-trideoxy-beta-L-altropyranose hydrolase
MAERLIVRADAGREYGAGHIVRCIALAHMLKHAFDVDFYSTSIPIHLKNEIEHGGWRVFTLSDDEFMKAIPKDRLVILDGYHFDTEYQLRIKEMGAKLVCIDDLHDREFFADLIINYAPGMTQGQYRAQSYTSFALGSDYALLRPAFIQHASIKRSIGHIQSVLICFGGSDVNDFTLQSLAEVLTFEEFHRIFVVTGPSYENVRGIEALSGSDPRVTYFHNITERQMLDTMMQAELAIVPASGILLEAISAGNTPLICYYAENQRHLHDYLVETYKVASFNSKPDALSAGVRMVLERKEEPSLELLRKSISTAPANIIKVINSLLV